MQWIVLGSGTAAPIVDRGCASHLLVGDGVAALFDSGSGTKDRLARAGVVLGQLTHLVYTHAHLDHWADLLTLLFYRANAPSAQRRDGLTVAGPKGFSRLVKNVISAAHASLLESNADVVYRDLEPQEQLDAGWFRARAFAVEHGSQIAQAYRVQGPGWSLCYSGDTAPCAGIEAASRNVNCLVCECAFPDTKAVESHMTPREVRRLADKVQPGLLVLTHLYPEVLDAGVPGPAFEGYDGRVVVASDGLVITLPQGRVESLGW